ncbi:MAG: T9SS type A sorting domain-containing protein, partial [Flavobacteriales bacterium]|nr:T9SS type A sorting domain-containing protein [Flavobacteriales bacterium]
PTLDGAIFPNPGSDHFIVAISPSEVATLNVYDAAGHVILNGKIVVGSAIIDASAWPQGLYQVRSQDRAGKTRTSKWVKP